MLIPRLLSFDLIDGRRYFPAPSHASKSAFPSARTIFSSITSFPIGAGVDYAGFDPSAGLIFFSCADGTLSIFHQKSADAYEDAGALKTQPSAKTMAVDPKTGKIFLPAAEYDEVPATDGKRPQRTMKPGSFVVLVVGK